MLILKEKKELKVILTTEERLEIGQNIARESTQMASEEETKTEVVSEFKARIESHKAKIAELSRTLMNGYQFREVECRREFDFKKGIVAIIREDTGELVKERPITEQERQDNLPGVTGEPART